MGGASTSTLVNVLFSFKFKPDPRTLQLTIKNGSHSVLLFIPASGLDFCNEIGREESEEKHFIL
jgi:hypothetical protein